MIEKPKAFDATGLEIQVGDKVEIVKESAVKHSWLKVGNTLIVTRWEDRTFGKTPYICVFLKSKKGGRSCMYGVKDTSLKVTE